MATETPGPGQTKRLGEMLLEADIISEGQLNEALEKKKAEGGFLGKVLIDMKFLDEHTLINFLVKQFKIPHISLLDYDIAQEVLTILPKEVCIQYNLVPIDKLGKILTIAMVDPLDTVAMTKVKEACPDIRIKPILCSWQHFEHVMKNAYPDEFQAAEQSSGDAGSLSMESLGLSGGQPAKKKPAQPDAEPAPETAPAGPIEPPSAAEIHTLVDDTLRSGIEQATQHIADRVRDYVSASNGPFPLSGLELAERVRNAIGEASEMAGGAILQDTKKALDEAGQAASDLSAAELGQILQNSMRRALQETAGEILQEAARSVAKRGGD